MLLSRQLTLALPPSAIADREHPAGVDGVLSVEAIELGDHTTLTLRDLPCEPGDDLLAASLAEVARRARVSVSALRARALPLSDASLRAVEVIPSLRVGEGNDDVILWAFIAVDAHVILATGSRWMLADGLEPARADPTRRVRIEAILASARRGDWHFRTGLHGETGGDLMRAVEAPEGWVLREAGCCNEEPPYTTRFEAHVLRTRALGEPTRARISARNMARCDAGRPGPTGRVHGVPMQWTHVGDHLCWVESTTENERGVTWHVRGATAAELDEAVAIASEIGR